MVLYTNINVGQRVEVLLDGGVYRGTVKYKGYIATRKGDWVGLALDEPVGEHCGMVRGRRYFQCKERHGIFVRAGKVRFLSTSNRSLYNKYHTVSRSSFVEENLFNSMKPSGQNCPLQVSASYLDRTKSSLEGISFSSSFSKPKNFHLGHKVSNTIPAVNMRRPQTAMAAFAYPSFPVHTEYGIDGGFLTSPSVPQTHMPHSALRRQVGRGWGDAHYVRHMSVGTGRDSLKFSQWNDITE